jgi:hypothetical protein
MQCDGGTTTVIPRRATRALDPGAVALPEEVTAWSAAGLWLDETIMTLHVPTEQLADRLCQARTEIMQYRRGGVS